MDNNNNKIDVFAMIDEYMKKKNHEEAVKMIDRYIEETAREKEMERIMYDRFMAMTYMTSKKHKRQKRKRFMTEIMARMIYLTIGLLIVAGVITIIK